MYEVRASFAYFLDLDGSHLENGSVWMGQPFLDPIIYPIVCYWDAEGTIAAQQPFNTINGIITRDGAPARVFVPSDFSITVKNRQNKLVYTLPTTDYTIGATPAHNAQAVKNNAELAQLNVADHPIVLRYSFAEYGDCQPVYYIGIAAPPTINGGAGDGGWQIPSADGGRFELIYPTGGVSPKIWGAVARNTVDVDSYLALTAMLAFLGSLPHPEGLEFYEVDGNGETYCTTRSLGPTYLSRLNVRNLTIKAMDGALWSGNNASADLGFGTNGIITLNSTSYVLFENCAFDANWITNCQCAFITGGAGYRITFNNCTFRHWAATGNGVIVNGPIVTFDNCDFIQFQFGDVAPDGSRWGVQASYKGIALGYFETYDGNISKCKMYNTQYPIYIDPGTGNLRFMQNEIVQESNNDVPFVNPIGLRYGGTECDFVGNDFRYCRILFEISALTTAARLTSTFSNNRCGYSASNSTFAAWIEITTSLAHTMLFGLDFHGNDTSSGDIFAYALTVTGAGSFSRDGTGAGDFSAATIAAINSYRGAVTLDRLGSNYVDTTKNENKLGLHYLSGNKRLTKIVAAGTYTASNDDCGLTLIFTGGGGCVITLPNSFTLTYNGAFQCRMVSTAAASSLVVGSGATLNGALNGTAALVLGKMYYIENVSGTGANASYSGMGNGW